MKTLNSLRWIFGFLALVYFVSTFKYITGSFSYIISSIAALCLGLLLFPLFSDLIFKYIPMPSSKAFKVMYAITLLIIIFLSLTMNKESSQQTVQNIPLITINPTGIINTQTPADLSITTYSTSPIDDTPTPIDPCKQYAGTDQFVPCNQLKSSMEKGLELKHPLKAKITYNNYSISITNTENVEWTGCTAELNNIINPSTDTFGANVEDLSPGQTATIRWMDMVNFDNQKYNYYQTKPSSIDLECSVNKELHRSIFTL